MTEVRDGWGPYDLLSSDGIKIEVKSSGYIQDWRLKKESSLIFGIGRKRDWYKETNTYSDYPVRSSDIYVFCLYNRRATDSPDTLDPLMLPSGIFTFCLLRYWNIRFLNKRK